MGDRVPTSAELFRLADRLEACADEVAHHGTHLAGYDRGSLNDYVWTAAEQYAKANAVRERARRLQIIETGVDKREPS